MRAAIDELHTSHTTLQERVAASLPSASALVELSGQVQSQGVTLTSLQTVVNASFGEVQGLKGAVGAQQAQLDEHKAEADAQKEQLAAQQAEIEGLKAQVQELARLLAVPPPPPPPPAPIMHALPFAKCPPPGSGGAGVCLLEADLNQRLLPLPQRTTTVCSTRARPRAAAGTCSAATGLVGTWCAGGASLAQGLPCPSSGTWNLCYTNLGAGVQCEAAQQQQQCTPERGAREGVWVTVELEAAALTRPLVQTAVPAPSLPSLACPCQTVCVAVSCAEGKLVTLRAAGAAVCVLEAEWAAA